MDGPTSHSPEESGGKELSFLEGIGGMSSPCMDFDLVSICKFASNESEVLPLEIQDESAVISVRASPAHKTDRETCSEEMTDPASLIVSSIWTNETAEASADLKVELDLNPIDLKPDTSETVISKPEEFDGSSAFSINSPPSPVYPPKSLKLHDFQALRTRIDKIPLHKKKQILIPSPSSPVEEVRKKFELQASKSLESPTTDIKYRSHAKDLTPKVVKRFENVEMVPEASVSKPDAEPNSKCKSILTKRHSEPPPKIESSPSSEMIRRISNKYEGESSRLNKSLPIAEKQPNKPKALQPSLFTQLKIRKLQSLQAESGSAPEHVDPWSDPILDMQEDYHPITSYLHSLITKDSVPADVESTEDESNLKEKVEDVLSDTIVPAVDDCEVVESERVQDIVIGKTSSNAEIDDQTVVVQSQDNKRMDSCETDNQPPNSKSSENTPENEAVKRERINRIKEERRAQLREKLKQESFRMEAEEKEKVQTKFRLRKDCSKHSLLLEPQEDLSKDIKKSDKAVETDSANIAETGMYCDLSVPMERLSDSIQSKTEGKPASGIAIESTPTKHPKSGSQQISSGDYVLLQNKSNSGQKSLRSYEEGRKWLSMPPTDIRDKVAMFERSKDTNDLYRLGQSGKFPQKQSPSALASSFVR